MDLDGLLAEIYWSFDGFTIAAKPLTIKNPRTRTVLL
jgi:hypothetical protein